MNSNARAEEPSLAKSGRTLRDPLERFHPLAATEYLPSKQVVGHHYS